MRKINHVIGEKMAKIRENKFKKIIKKLFLNLHDFDKTKISKL